MSKLQIKTVKESSSIRPYWFPDCFAEIKAPWVIIFEIELAVKSGRI